MRTSDGVASAELGASRKRRRVVRQGVSITSDDASVGARFEAVRERVVRARASSPGATAELDEMLGALEGLRMGTQAILPRFGGGFDAFDEVGNGLGRVMANHARLRVVTAAGGGNPPHRVGAKRTLGGWTAEPAVFSVTDRETLALGQELDMTSANPQLLAGRRVDLGAAWDAARPENQKALERELIRVFFTLQRQPSIAEAGRTLLNYSASIALKVVATYLAKHQQSISIIDPCLDAIAELFSPLPVNVIPEDLLRVEHGQLEQLRSRLERHVQSDALLLVDPNNPTGTSLLRHGRRGMEIVARFCAEKDILLVIDASMASFAAMRDRSECFDLYELLDGVGVRYVAVEDTGKVTPEKDIKCGLLTSSQDLYGEFAELNSSFIRNVPPLTLSLLISYLTDFTDNRWGRTLEVLDRNRAALAARVKRLGLTLLPQDIEVSVGQIALPDGIGIDSTQLADDLRDEGLHVLPGEGFHPFEPELGGRTLRWALMREPEVTDRGLARLTQFFDDNGAALVSAA